METKNPGMNTDRHNEKHGRMVAPHKDSGVQIIDEISVELRKMETIERDLHTGMNTQRL